MKRVIELANRKWAAQRLTLFGWRYLGRDQYLGWTKWEYVNKYCLVDTQAEAVKIAQDYKPKIIAAVIVP